MARITIDIRGSFGGQICCFLAHAANAYKHGDRIGQIRLNVGKPLDPASEVSYLPLVFGNLPEIKKVDAKAKFDLLVNGWTKNVLDFRKWWYKDFQPIEFDRPIPGLTILHVRMGDREATSLDTYMRVAREMPGGSLTIVGNDVGFCRQLAALGGHTFTRGEPINDWRLLHQAERIIAGPSYFTFSALLFSPHLCIHYLPNDGIIPMSEKTMKKWAVLPYEFPHVTLSTL